VQFAWAELPVTTERGGVVYVTHYVSADGTERAKADEPGRVRNYSIAYDKRRRQPLWVAAPMHLWYRSPRNTNRTDYWWWDPAINVDYQPNLERSYRQLPGGGNYSRGHLVASADRLREWELNAQTFYFTNMAPQIQDGFNDGLWNDLEQDVQRWGDATSDTLYVVTGSAFLGDGQSGGIDTTSDIDGNRIPVPSHFYKVLLSSKSRTGRSVGELGADELRAVGFWIEHNSAGGRVSKENMKSVAEIEELVGEKFFPILSEEAQSVKESFNAADWGFR
jgi:endonuclease G